ncbi:MAG TPA: ribosomal protein S18-alanine N-acetyltransferase [Gemmatimonadales bacterium]|nr:ribosomal protein S18-alanine N-acetyltransferase [Gemmatimonadales bacterium]
MGAHFQIRPATPADLPHVAAIEQAVFSDPWPLDAFLPLLSENALVLEGHEGVRGYLFARVMGPEAEILNLAILPERQGRGWGRRLLQASLDRLSQQGVSDVFLEVRRSNAKARAFYARMGFEEAGLRRAYYTRPVEDAVVLRLKLVAEGRK